jgi:hypothetical protein
MAVAPPPPRPHLRHPLPGVLTPSDTADWFKLAAAPGDLVLTASVLLPAGASPRANLDLQVDIRDAQGSTLATVTGDPLAGLPASLTFAIATAGTTSPTATAATAAWASTPWPPHSHQAARSRRIRPLPRPPCGPAACSRAAFQEPQDICQLPRQVHPGG